MNRLEQKNRAHSDHTLQSRASGHDTKTTSTQRWYNNWFLLRIKCDFYSSLYTYICAVVLWCKQRH